MTITLPAEPDSILNRLVALGLFRTPQEAVIEAVKRLEREVTHDSIFADLAPLTPEEAEQIYAPDPEWEAVERAMAGRARPEI